MIRIIYASAASTLAEHPHWRSMLIQHNRDHPQQPVSGVLLLMRDDFLQVLEGPDEVVDALFAHMHAAGQHSLLTLLSREVTEERLFDGWEVKEIVVPPPDNRPPPKAAELLAGSRGQQGRAGRFIGEFLDGKWHHHPMNNGSPRIVHR